MRITIKELRQIDEAARQFIAAMGPARVIAFYGKMGVGKTTFIKALCRQLGVREVITSPTFAIVNEYEASKETGGICHFDSNRGRSYCMAPYSFNGGQLGWRYPSIEAAIEATEGNTVAVTVIAADDEQGWRNIGSLLC